MGKVPIDIEAIIDEIRRNAEALHSKPSIEKKSYPFMEPSRTGNL